MSSSKNDNNLRSALVVLDANIWIGSRLLKSSLGAALLYVLRQINGQIGLSKITEAEAIKDIVEAGEDAVRKIDKNFLTLQAITGIRPDYPFPSHHDFEKS